ncbi:MAG: ABC transporter permease [Tannerella sp.]|jgi:putative ABC transport system permease protein|nr:ABC transporter permease [Tannerella sp.]
MKTIIRNFISVLRRYKLAAVLNVLGLSVAFAAFMLIMMQVGFDRSYDRSHPNADRIFRVETVQGSGDGGLLGQSGQAGAVINRPLSEALFQSSPHILAGAIANLARDFFFSVESNGAKNFYEEKMRTVSPAFADIFTFDMVEGDGRTLDEPDRALIPLSLSRKLFGSEPASGRMLAGRDRNLTVGGVYRDFPRNSSVENAVFTQIDPRENINTWGNWNYAVFVRLDAPENADGLFDNFRRSFDLSTIRSNLSWDSDGVQLRFSPLTELHFLSGVFFDMIPKSSRRTLFVLISIAFVIVIIAGINYTNFSAALAPKRIRSINTQKVFGGSTRVIRAALVMEGVATAFVSFLIGTALVYLAQRTSLAQAVDADISLAQHAGLVAATAGLALVTGVLAGLYPSFYITSFQPALVLKGTFGLSASGRMLRNVLICIQFVASFVLIISASFLFLQNRFMQRTPLGYDHDALIVTNLSEQAGKGRDALTGSLKEFAGIEDVTYAESLLSSQDQYMGWGRMYHEEQISFQILPVEPSFLRVMGIEVTEGRSFREEDRRTRQGVYIFNETAHRDYNLVLNDRIDSAEIAGFMPDVKFNSLRRSVTPMAFYVWGTENWGRWPGYAYVKVKAGADLRAAITHVRSTLRTFDGEFLFNVRFFDEVLNSTYEAEQRFGVMITLFSLVAIFISIVGVFGLVVFDSEYRRREIGIRKIFGSTTGEILVTFNRSYVRMLVLCFVVSAPVAWYAVMRWLENFAYRAPMHWWVYAAAFVAVFLLTVATVTFQNWRAANMNPVDSVKAE